MENQQGKKRAQAQITSFFSVKKPRAEGEGEVDENTEHEESDQSQPQDASERHSPHADAEKSDQSEITISGGLSEDEEETIFNNDVGAHLGKVISDEQKCKLLESPWKPPENFKYPFSTQGKGKTRRFLRKDHLERYEWLVYSPLQKGLFCKYCPWFTPQNRGGANEAGKLEKLVRIPLVNFKDLSGPHGDLEAHAGHLYHKKAVASGKDFLRAYHSPKIEIINQVDEHRRKMAEENRQRLIPIVESILFCGRNNLPLRGHRDDGSVLQAQSSSSKSKEREETTGYDGVFRNLLRFRVSAGDKNLENHLLTASSRATYTSKTTQEELIRICGQIIVSRIVARVLSSPFYSVLFDETTDEGGVSQMSLVLRYLHNSKIREDFIGFVDNFKAAEDAMKEQRTILEKEKQSQQEEAANGEEAGILEEEEQQTGSGEGSGNSSTSKQKRRRKEPGDSDADMGKKELSLTGKVLGKIVLKSVKQELQLPVKKMMGIGTDSAGPLVSEDIGAVTEIQKEAEFAIHCPCFNHKLNNGLKKTCKVTAVRNATDIMQKTVSIFAYPKRRYVLKKYVPFTLSSTSDTRWVEQHDGVLQFQTDLPGIVAALQEIEEWKDATASSNASSLITALTQPQFIVALVSTSDVLSLTKPLSVLLQKPSLDLSGGADKVADLIAVLSSKRENAEQEFSSLWKMATELAAKLPVDPLVKLEKPRLASRQVHQDNHSPDSSPEEYYRRSVYIQLLDHVINDLKTRFSQDVLNVFQLPVLLPDQIVAFPPSDDQKYVEDIMEKFSGSLETETDSSSGALALRAEVQLWRQMWVRKKAEGKPIPSTAVTALDHADSEVFPIIWKLLNILAVLPVSNASPERSFSTLRRLKTWLRSTMVEERLNGLALMYVHREEEISVDEVIDIFAKSKDRRVEFVL